jgi:hypothetical protein
VIALVMRFFERRWGSSAARRAGRRRPRLHRAQQARHRAAAGVRVAYPITQEIEHLVRVLGFAPPRLERLIPGLHDSALASFLVYFVLYDFAAYWVHRAQHRFAWWWALHSLHHSQRRVTEWSDDRNHILDDLLVNLVLRCSPIRRRAARRLRADPDVGRLVESWSHANVDMGFGRLARGCWSGRASIACTTPSPMPPNRISTTTIFAPVFPIWDILFGTARFDRAPRRPGVDDALIDADNGRGWLSQQAAGFRAVRRGPGAPPPTGVERR